MRLAVMRGAAVASIGMVALCVPTGWGGSDNFERVNVLRPQACAPAPSGAVLAILSSSADLDTTRFEFRLPVDADVAAVRVPRETRGGPTVEKRPPPSATRTTLPASGVPASSVAPRVFAPRVPKLSVTGIRTLQSELKRLGCYTGRIDGDWGPASRYAAAKFTGAVNAALPVEKPEPALLALARRHDGTCNKIPQSSAIVTASTTPITRAVISPGAALENTAASRETSDQTQTPQSGYAWHAPRVVRANGRLATGSDLTPLLHSKNSYDGSMALGAAPRSPPAAQPSKRQRRHVRARKKKSRRRVVYRTPRVRRKGRVRRRSRVRRRVRYRTARRYRNTWERRVWQTFRLSGW